MVSVGAKVPPLAVRPGEGAFLGQQLRALYLETELGKRKNVTGVFVLVGSSC